MWNKVCDHSTGRITGHNAVRQMPKKKETLEILPCTVSQLLSASEMNKYTFAICDWQLNQVSVVGVIREYSPSVTNILFSVDDMTGPPISVKQWVNAEDSGLMMFASPGTYVRVTGNLRSFRGERSLLAMNMRCIKDLNEITSHMLEVVQAHMQLFRKVFDVNMNTTLTSLSGRSGGGDPVDISPKDLFTNQDRVLHVIRKFSPDDGISFHDLKTHLDSLSEADLRSALTFLVNEGHVFSTIDEHHFKSTEH